MPICLTLAPYQSLTPLTFAVLALHPHIQVMNHAFNYTRMIAADPALCRLLDRILDEDYADRRDFVDFIRQRRLRADAGQAA
jgi:hypothetical protein